MYPEENLFVSTTLSPIGSITLKIIGFCLILNLILSLKFNALLLLTFIRCKKLRNKYNFFIITITIFNLIGCIEMPFVIHSSFKAK